MTPLRRKMREDMQIRNYAKATQKGYLWRVGQFARHYRRSPDRLGLKESHEYQVHLLTECHASGGDVPISRRHPCALGSTPCSRLDGLRWV